MRVRSIRGRAGPRPFRAPSARGRSSHEAASPSQVSRLRPPPAQPQHPTRKQSGRLMLGRGGPNSARSCGLGAATTSRAVIRANCSGMMKAWDGLWAAERCGHSCAETSAPSCFCSGAWAGSLRRQRNGGTSGSPVPHRSHRGKRHRHYGRKRCRGQPGKAHARRNHPTEPSGEPEGSSIWHYDAAFIRGHGKVRPFRARPRAVSAARGRLSSFERGYAARCDGIACGAHLDPPHEKLDPKLDPTRRCNSALQSRNRPYKADSGVSGRQDLNLRPPGPQPGALPDCATPRGWTRF